MQKYINAMASLFFFYVIIFLTFKKKGFFSKLKEQTAIMGHIFYAYISYKLFTYPYSATF